MEWVTTRRRRAGANARPLAATLARATVIGAALVVLAVGCGSRRSSTAELVDGTTPPPLPSIFDDFGDSTVATRARRWRISQLGATDRACLRRFRPEFSIPRETVAVERTGLTGASLTFEDGRRAFVLGCDRTGRPGEAAPPWCARSVGRLVFGRLSDPRVDILCRRGPPDDGPIGFAWVDPTPTTRWLAVRNDGRTELYEVLAGLPVRVATTRVEASTSSAVVDLTEYDAAGEVVCRRRLRASVAG